jgi:hypothetical protein
LGKIHLYIAKLKRQSASFIKVLQILTDTPEYDLQNRLGIPKIVTIHGLDKLRRQDTVQWVRENLPILIGGQYMQNQQSSTIANELEEVGNDDDGFDGFASFTTQEEGYDDCSSDFTTTEEDEIYFDVHFDMSDEIHPL